MTAPTQQSTAGRNAAVAGSALALAEAARQAQIAIRRTMLVDVAKAWPLLNFQHVDRSWPTWLRVMSAVLGQYHQQSAQAGGLFYRAARQAAIGDPGDVAIVKLAAPPSAEWVARALGYSAVGVYRKQTVDLGRPSDVGAKAALTQTLGTSARIVQDGSRTTVLDSTNADDRAIGWYRVTDADPCALCALIASRGVVEKSTTYRHDSFAQSNARFVGPGKFKVHNECGCDLAPVYSKDQPLPAINQQAADVYLSRGHGDALVAFRKAWNARKRPA